MNKHDAELFMERIKGICKFHEGMHNSSNPTVLFDDQSEIDKTDFDMFIMYVEGLHDKIDDLEGINEGLEDHISELQDEIAALEYEYDR